MNPSSKEEARLFNLMKNLRDRKKKRKRKKNLLSFQGPSPLVCPINSYISCENSDGVIAILWGHYCYGVIIIPAPRLCTRGSRDIDVASCDRKRSKQLARSFSRRPTQRLMLLNFFFMHLDASPTKRTESILLSPQLC
jgi:hypothetical protein